MHPDLFSSAPACVNAPLLRELQVEKRLQGQRQEEVMRRELLHSHFHQGMDFL